MIAVIPQPEDQAALLTGLGPALVHSHTAALVMELLRLTAATSLFPMAGQLATALAGEAGAGAVALLARHSPEPVVHALVTTCHTSPHTWAALAREPGLGAASIDILLDILTEQEQKVGFD